jgi:hypothetical protein
MRGIEEQMRIRRESNMFNLENQKTPKMNKQTKKE